MVTHRREITDSDMEALLGEIVAFLHEHQVDHAAIERATHFAGADGAGVGARAALMLRSQHVGGEIAGTLRAAPFLTSVRTSSSTHCRAALRKVYGCACRQKKHTKACMVAAVTRAFGGTLPTDDEHVVDAGVVAAARALPERKREPRAERAEGAAAPKRSSAASNAARTRAKQEKRAALGCHCEGRGHVDGCPVKVAENAKRSAAMKGNANRTGKTAAASD
jgi:hypothetical protein